MRRYEKYKEDARKLVQERLVHYNKHYNFKIGRISIRDQKTRWGSCSSKGNLNFNYKIVFLPIELVDHIVVHELCHLKEFNHSKNFWDLVAEQHPEHLKSRAELTKIRWSLRYIFRLNTH
jgi:predicted metal-dependent hydrolase